MPLTQSRLKELLTYNKNTGTIRWKPTATKKMRGKVAGKVSKFGYREIGIDGKVYLAQKLVWFFVYGVLPSHSLDHRNRNRDDNRIENLRPATTAQNQQNCSKHKDNKSGYKGVTVRKGLKKPYRAAVQTGGKMHHVGYFATAKEASDAYLVKARELFGEYACRG